LKEAHAFKKELINYYDKLSENYDELYGSEQRTKYSLMINTLNIEKVERVLDFGCGTGLLLKTLEEIGVCFLIGVDISSGMLAKAKEKALKYVDLILCDGELLPIRDEVFDVVFMVTVFQNLCNKRKGLKQAIRVMRRNGITFISVPNKFTYPIELLRYVGTEDEIVPIKRISGSKDMIIVLEKAVNSKSKLFKM